MSYDADEIAAVSDPGEIDRETHKRGDRAVVGLSNLLAWLFPVLMMVIVIQVLLRNFGRIGVGPGNQAWMDDLQWWVYGIACLVGVAYAVTTNSHVRVDIFYDNYPDQKRRRVDLFALGWLFLPFTILTWDITFHYAYASILSWEGSDSPNGLHNLWALKVMMNMCFILLAVAIFTRVLRILSNADEDTGWARFVWTLPSVLLSANLVIFYAFWWITRLTDPEMNPRSIARNGLMMAEIEYGPYETKLTVFAAFAVTAVLGAVLYTRRAR